MVGEETKVCSRCGEEKGLGEFCKNQRWCRECFSEYNQKAYQEHPEKKKAYSRQYHAEHREERKIKLCQNGVKYRDRRTAYARRYWAKNPEKKKAIQHKRRTKKIGNGGSFTAEEWIAVCGLYGNCCACCRRKTQLTVDHIIPISLGGTSDIANIQPLCAKCNTSKGVQAIQYLVKHKALCEGSLQKVRG